MPSVRVSEISQAIELVTQLQYAISHRTFHSDAVPGLHDTLSEWLVEAGREMEQAEAPVLRMVPRGAGV